MRVLKTTATALLFFICLASAGFGAEPGRLILRGHVPAAVAQLTPKDRLAATNHLSLALGLPLRNENALDELIAQLYDPRSTNYHKYLTPAEFTARFGPTETDYQAVIQFAETNGLTVTGKHNNRVVLDVAGRVADIERAFQVTLRTYRHPTENRDFFASDADPSVAEALSVLHISGLDNYSLRRPMSVVRPLTTTAQVVPRGGSGVSGSYMGNDFRAAYVPGVTLTGSGQSVALLQFDGYGSNDIASYISQAGLTNYPSLTNVSVNGGVPFPGNGALEVCLDIEMVVSMAPDVSKIIVYEAPNTTAWSTILSAIANDTNNPASQISCSWGNSSAGPKDPTSEGLFKQMAAQGQSFFNASGDSDAFVGGVPFPSESTNITQVGGTTLFTTGPGGAWSSEVAWNRGGGVGGGGGVSANYGIPGWQQGISMTANQGSTTLRNVPDVALTSEWVFVVTSGNMGIAAGTCCAAPLWAGFMELVNQQAAAVGQGPAGFINPAVYAIGKSSIYNSCFNDTTTGNNFSPSSPTNFPAVTGYDLCTGWGTPTGSNLINALVWPQPIFLTQPASRNVTNGTSVTFSATVSGATPFIYNWLCNGTNLFDGGNLSGSTGNVLSITAATTNNSGSYQLVVSNLTSVSTSSPAILNVGFVPVVSTPPTNLTILSGSNAVFSAAVGGSTPLVFHWRKNGANLANGAGISGATNNILTLTTVTTNSGGNYNLSVTNMFGVATSSVAVLTVVLPPSITKSSLTNRTGQCGSNNLAYSVTAAGTSPLKYQWSLDGTPVANATNTSFSVTNLHLPSHIVGVIITNLYGSFVSNAVLTMQDSIAPAMTLLGSNPMTLELGSAFTDPGVTATDICAGVIGVTVSGLVNPNLAGTNTLTYKAGDGNGNTNTATRTVIVRDTTPPAILWSFTNLVLAADTNCSAKMPVVTGTNYVLATDLSGALTISQSPTNNVILFLGTNRVVITVKDSSGNAAYATNKIMVQDQTPPVIIVNGARSIFSELGQAFADPGATASDACAGLVVVMVGGSVNTNAVGTNTLTYTTDDGHGNTNTATRTVIVRDTTPPAIWWSFTNLVLAADTNCGAAVPDVTGTNFILATDLSGVPAVSQIPTNGSILLVGTNMVVLAVSDVFSNTAFSTNTIVVQDQTPPVILGQPQSETNNAGETANFSIAATACSLMSFQWYFGNDALDGQTNGTLTLLNVNPTAAGNYSVVVTASGGASTSAVAVLTVNLLTSTIALASSANPCGFNDGVHFVAAVTPASATGSIQFFINDTAFDSEMLLAGQAASANISLLPRGTNVVTAIYSGDANDLPATNLLWQIVTNHPPVATDAFYTNSLDAPLTIAIDDLATNWSDVDGDVVSLADVSVTTNGITLTNDGTMLVYFNSNHVADQFTCTITDGWSGANFQTVFIVPAPVPDTTPRIAGVVVATNGVTLSLGGAPGYTYVLETTTNLFLTGGWLPVATNTLGTNGVWQFTDSASTNIMQGFYRLKLGP